MDVLEELARGAYNRAIDLDPFDVAVDCGASPRRLAAARGRVRAWWTGGSIKRSVAVGARDIPLGTITALANRHNSPLLAETLDTVEASFAGPLPEGANVHLDRGYDSEPTRKRLE